MTYFVRCRTYTACVLAAKDFANNYSEKPAILGTKDPTVKAGDHTFVFVHDGKKRKDEIPIDQFVKRYFSEPTPKSQTP